MVWSENYWVKTPFITISKRNERFESRWTSKSYYMFTFTQDLPQRSHITWNLSVTTHLSRRFFVLDEIFSVLFIWLFFFQYFFSFWPVHHFSSYLATWPFLSWERICIGMMAGEKPEEKRLRKCIDFMARGSFCIRRSLQVVVPIRISLSLYVEFWKLGYI